MKINEKRLIKIFLYIAAAAVSYCLVFFFSDIFIQLTATLALQSAKSYLPEKGISLPVITTETTKKVEAAIADTIKKEETTEKAELQTTEAKITTAVSTLAASDEKFTDTPEDIKALIAEAEKKAAKDKKDASISEYKYISDGVTDKLGPVRVKNVNKTDIDLSELFKKKPDLTVKKNEPSVLIFHTHTTETYQILDRSFYAQNFLSRTNDKNKNMVRVGKAVAEEIEKEGYTVIHDTEIHDSKYNGAYSHSRKTVEEYLKKYPSIKIVLDVHRDAIQRTDGTKIKPTAEIQGKKAAQIMIISGCQEKDNGVGGFPDWKENLVFALHLQKKLEELYEGITRPLYFSPRKYNMDLTNCSLLVEVGSDANTLEEAVYTGKCLGVAVSEILKEYEE